MFSSKVIALLAVIFLITTSASSSSLRTDPCKAQRRCSFDEIIVRALGRDNRCILFRNDCHFLNDLCQRKANNQPILKRVNRNECQAKCNEICTDDYRPVCAHHNGVEFTFTNRCDMNRLACKQDKSYMFSHDGACKKSTA